MDSEAGFVNIKAASPNTVIMVIINHWLYIILQRTLPDFPVPFLRIYHFTPVLSIPGKIILYRQVTAVAPNIVFVEMRQSCFFRMRRIFIERIQKSITVKIQTAIRNCHFADLTVWMNCSKSTWLKTHISRPAVMIILMRNLISCFEVAVIYFF